MQLDLFPDLKVTRTRSSKEYGAFTDKFKTKLTTDDCYTPEPVYNAVRDWCVEKYGLKGREIVRPFWPGADFEMYNYPENCVVIDNPPFSIYNHVLDFYINERPTDFFLFAPSLTLFKKYDACYVVCNEIVEYANGAKVNTSFVTSLDKENRVICDQTLKHAIRTANAYGKPKKADLPIIEMPQNVITAAILGKTTRVEFAFKKKDCAFINKINGKRTFGNGFILSDRAAADRAAADRAATDRAATDREAADREAARKKIVITFGKEELKLLNQINQSEAKMNNLLSKIKKGPTKLPPKIMLIGVEGVGKSTAGASMPNPIFVCGESGLVGPQFEGIPNFTPESWKDILDFCEELAATPGDFRTLVIDTLDWVEPMLYAHVCAEGKQKNIEGFGYGKGYVLAQQEARKLLVALDKVNRAGLNILLLSHSQLRKVQNVLGDDYDHFESKLNGKVGGIFKEWADAVLFARFETFVEKVDNKVKAYGGSTRVVETTHSAAWDAKNRYGLPEQMPLDMLAILSAMDGNGGDAKAAEIELRGLLERLPKDKADKTLKWLETPRSVVDLQKVLNNVKNAIKEAENG